MFHKFWICPRSAPRCDAPNERTPAYPPSNALRLPIVVRHKFQIWNNFRRNSINFNFYHFYDQNRQNICSKRVFDWTLIKNWFKLMFFQVPSPDEPSAVRSLWEQTSAGTPSLFCNLDLIFIIFKTSKLKKYFTEQLNLIQFTTFSNVNSQFLWQIIWILQLNSQMFKILNNFWKSKNRWEELTTECRRATIMMPVRPSRPRLMPRRDLTSKEPNQHTNHRCQGSLSYDFFIQTMIN